MARFQRFLPILAIVLIVLLGGTAMFINETRVVAATMSTAADQANVSATEADSAAGTAALMVDVPGLPY